MGVRGAPGYCHYKNVVFHTQKDIINHTFFINGHKSNIVVMFMGLKLNSKEPQK